MNHDQHTTCRICGYDKLTPYLDLGMMPLSNQLCETASEEAERFPLVVCLCGHCGLSQLSVVIPPEKLFAHYVYRSGISEGYKKHCRKMAEDLNLKDRAFHIDIAGNDGTLLTEFRNLQFCNELDYRPLNIDPAENLVKINEEKGIRQYTTFWGMKAVEHLKATHWPLADLITATNVIAHVDDIREFMMAIREMLAPDGRAVIECPDIMAMIEKKQFNQIYFEHASYMSVTPFVKLCNDLGLIVLDVEKFEIHGGSLRFTVGHKGTPTESVNDWMYTEARRGYNALGLYKDWADEVKGVIRRFRELLSGLSVKPGAFAASAKGNTMLNAAGITNDYIRFIIDETPEKIGKFSPGTNIPIISLEKFDMRYADYVEYIVVLAENFWDEIVAKCRANGFKGKFINPLTCEIV